MPLLHCDYYHYYYKYIHIDLSHLFVNLNGLLVILKLSRVLGDLQKTFVSGRIAFFPTEIIGGLLVMLYGPFQIDSLALVHFRYALMVFGRHRKSSHVGVDFDGLQQTADSL